MRKALLIYAKLQKAELLLELKSKRYGSDITTLRDKAEKELTNTAEVSEKTIECHIQSRIKNKTDGNQARSC